MLTHKPVGINCTISWWDSPDGEEEVFISFMPEEFDTPLDLETFFYLDEAQVKKLQKSIETGRNKHSLGEDWFIDLTAPYEFDYEVIK